MKHLVITSFIFLFSALSIILPDQKFSRDELIGKGDPALYGGESIGLRKEAYESFLKMKEAAAKEGIDINVVSGYRNYARQKGIWERKYKAYTTEGLKPEEAIDKIIEWSTIPGTSRHHWGTDIDIIDGSEPATGDVLVPEKFHGEGPYRKLRVWLEAHAADYGFYIVYTNKPDRKGFKYEPWHYSYAPISREMLKQYRKLDVKKVLTEEKLMGYQFLTDAFIQRYEKENILDINPLLLN
ncbi:M15 family metallopeptidase [Robertkochia solimangrovi]|uniref:M15 family metallopeptidase n=1 Tax=Robertkochia solimangrovi TaxID=2213046 RepID=UPI001180AC1A|nr:M15 family metallopeptidase [Robertkochia solimangrovi]TRZ41417.1 D-alanyl-D-alanine carboxypeptidase family protein [Robertkochia solimangrovi]